MPGIYKTGREFDLGLGIYFGNVLACYLHKRNTMCT